MRGHRYLRRLAMTGRCALLVCVVLAVGCTEHEPNGSRLAPFTGDVVLPGATPAPATAAPSSADVKAPTDAGAVDADTAEPTDAETAEPAGDEPDSAEADTPDPDTPTTAEPPAEGAP